MPFFGVPSSSENFDAKPLVSDPIHPAPPRIAHGATVAAAPKPTTLLGLPAELRNAIYTHVLVLPDPILIFWGHSYRRLGDHNSNLVPIRASPDWLLKKTGEPSQLVRMAHPGLAIFATCRQVYHEASSIFFGNCQFTTSRPSCEHTKKHYYERHLNRNRHDSHGAIIAESADWLASGLGSQLSQLQRLTIDISALCTPQTRFVGRDEAGAYLEFLPLLRVLWNRAWNGKVELCLSTTDAQARPLCQKGHTTSPEKAELDAEKLTEMLESLRQDEFDIRKFERTMGHVAVNRSGRRGVAVFRSTFPGPCPNHTHKYFSEKHDESIGLVTCPCLQHRLEFGHDSDTGFGYTKQPGTRLLDLPSDLRWDIFRHCLISSQVITVDLDRCEERPGLIYMNRSLHFQGFCRYYAANKFSLRMKFGVQGTRLIHLNALDGWMSSGDFTGRQHMLGRKGKNVQSIVLTVDCSNALGILPLDETRINTAALKRQCYDLSHIPTSVEIHVRIVSILEDGSERLWTESCFFFMDMNLKAMRVLKRLLDADWGLERTDNLEIVINGHGDPVGYVFPGSNRVLYGKPEDR